MVQSDITFARFEISDSPSTAWVAWGPSADSLGNTGLSPTGLRLACRLQGLERPRGLGKLPERGAKALAIFAEVYGTTMIIAPYPSALRPAGRKIDG